MVKQLLSKTLLLVAVLCTGATAAWADTYKKITSADDLEVGANYLIVYENGSSSKALGSINSSSYGNPVNVIVSNNEITITNQEVAVLTLGGSSSGWTFKSSLNNQYLSWSSGNTLTTSSSVSNSSKWTFQINTNGEQKIVNVGTVSRIIQYNSSSPRFACYSSNQKEACLYKKKEAIVDPTKEDAGIAWSAETASVTYNEEGVYSLPTLTNPHDLTVSYSSTNTEVATINSSTGVININNVSGSTDIIARFEGNDSYNDASVTYTLSVAKIAVIEDGVFNFDEDYAILIPSLTGTSSNSSTAGDITEDVTVVAGNVTLLIGAAEEGTNNRIWNSSPRLRLYSGTHTFSVPSGYAITSITINYGKWNGENTFNGVASTNGSWSGNAQNVELTIAGNTQIKSVVVEYEAVPASLTATVTSAGWATFVPKYNVKADNVNAYVVSLADDEVALLEKVSVIPAGTPVLLETEGTYTLYVIESATAVGNNCLKVSDGTISADDHVYVLGQKNKKTGFYLWTGDRLAVGKVYMYLDTSGARQMLQLVKPGQEETGIEAVESAGADREGIYNLQGIRVAEPSKGLYIVGGKKVMFNK